jgi:tetratricopeptide (TPR) repeat protein
MKKILLYLILLTNYSILLGQDLSVVEGLVINMSNNSTQTFLQNVSVYALSSKPQVSDSNGKFKLLFSSDKNGEVVLLHAERKGYSCVNLREIEQVVVGRRNTITIYMCREEELDERKTEYYKITRTQLESQLTLTKNSANRLENEIKMITALSDSLEDENKIKGEKLTQLKLELRSAYQKMTDLEFKLSHIKEQYDYIVDPLARESFRPPSEIADSSSIILRNGDIDGAIKLLNKSNISSKLGKLNGSRNTDFSIIGNLLIRRQYEDSVISGEIENSLKLAGLYEIKFEIDSAMKYFEIAAHYERINASTFFHAGLFMQNHSRFVEAENYYENALKLKINDEKRIRVLNNLGLIQTKSSNKDKFLSAGEQFGSALSILDGFDKESITEDLSFLRVNTLHNYADYFRRSKDFVQSNLYQYSGKNLSRPCPEIEAFFIELPNFRAIQIHT